MKPTNADQAGLRFVPLKIILLYVIFTLVWIYFSNTILLSLVYDHQAFQQFLKFKDFYYVLISSVILYFSFRAITRNLRQNEKKYRHLFENAAVSIWEEDFSAVKKFFDQQRALGVSNWRVYFEGNPQAVKQCASWVIITDCNQAGLRFLGVKSKAEVPSHLDYYFTEHSFKNFKEALIALAEGRTQWAGEIFARSLQGETMELMLQLAVVPGHEDDLSRILVSLLDITKSKEVEKIMLLKEERLRQIIDLVPHLIFARDMEGRFILVNRAVAEICGTTVENIIGKKDEDLAKFPEEVHHFHQDDLEVIRSGKPKFIQEPLTNAQGHTRLLSTTKIPFTASGTNSPCVLGVAIDITDYKRTEEALSQSRHFIDSILNSTPNLIYVHDLINKKNVYCNREALNFFGYTHQQIQEMGAQLFINILHPDDFSKVMGHHHSLPKDGNIREIEYRMKDASGQWRWIRSRDVLFASTSTGEPWQILGSAEDITDRKYLENKVSILANYDALTTVPNRTLFFEQAGLGLSHARRNNTACAVLFVDLDHFKNINDTLGHSIGDELLKDTALKLAGCIREVDIMARLGGINLLYSSMALKMLKVPSILRNVFVRNSIRRVRY